MFTRKIAAVVCAVGACLAAPAYAQNFNALLPSPNLTVAPTYPSTVPYGNTVNPAIQAITGFGTTFAFGSASTNVGGSGVNGTTSRTSLTNGFTEVNTNGHAIWAEFAAPLVGSTTGRGSNAPPTTLFGQGGATSGQILNGNPAGCTLLVNCSFQPQLQWFQRAYGSFKPNDIMMMFNGINDFSMTSNLQTTAQMQALVTTDVANQTELVRQSIALGARTVFAIGLYPTGTFAYFTQPPTGINNNPALLNQGAQLTNAGLLANLITLHQQTGANIHYFDTYTFVNQIRDNPTLYGYTAAGVAPNVACTLNQPVACGTRTFADQNSFLSLDGIHWSYRFHETMAQMMANQLLAPNTLAAQADMVDSTATAFSNSVLRRLDDYRVRNMAWNLMSADLPVKAPPPPQPGQYGAWSVYVEGLYANSKREDRLGGAGETTSVGGATIGADYHFSRSFLVGASFNYSNPQANLNQGWGSIKADAYQFAGYASWSYPNWFGDIAISGGTAKLDISRPGIVLGNQTGSTDANSFVANAKTGYLFDISAVPLGAGNAGTIKAGPIAGITYSRVHVNGYTESGDPVLNQVVNEQDTEGATGRVGLGIRSPVLFGSTIISPWLDVTAERDLGDGARTLVTAQQYAPLLTINTPVSNPQHTYGRVAGGFSAAIGRNVSLNLNGEATFGRADNNNDYALTGGFRVVW